MGEHYFLQGKDELTAEEKLYSENRRLNRPPGPNIQTAKEDHRQYCGRQDRAKRSDLGDVRYCEHGKIQLLIQPKSVEGNPTGGAYFWATLHPWWDMVKYYRAKKALS